MSSLEGSFFDDLDCFILADDLVDDLFRNFNLLGGLHFIITSRIASKLSIYLFKALFKNLAEEKFNFVNYRQFQVFLGFSFYLGESHKSRQMGLFEYFRFFSVVPDAEAG